MGGTAGAGWAAGRGRLTLGLVGLFALLYLPSLGFGYRGDDFRLLTTGWAAFWADPFAVAGRPMLSLSCVLSGAVSPASGFQHGVNVALFLGLVAVARAMMRRRRFPPVATLFLVAALCHPGMLWAVTWIAQRSDLLLLLFTCAAFASWSSRGSAGWLVLAAASKSPFVFQNLAFAVGYLRERRYASAAVAAATLPVFLYFGYVTYYATAVEVGSHGLFLLDSDQSGYWATVAFFRAVKIAEGLFYTFVPVSAFAVSIPWALASGAVWLAAWAAIVVDIVRSGVRLGDLRRDPNFAWMAATGLLLAVPYAFSSGLRIYVPATLFLYLAVGALARPRRLVVASISVIAAMHLAGVLLNYPASRGDCFDLDPALEASCQGSEVPAERWNRMRREIVDRFVKDALL